MLAMNKEEAAAYARDGYIIRKGLLSTEEVDLSATTPRRSSRPRARPAP